MSSNGRVWRVGVGIPLILYTRVKCTVSSLSLSFERSHAAADTWFVEDRDLNRRHPLGLILVYAPSLVGSSRASLRGALRLALQRPIQDMLAAVVDSTALPAPICADARCASTTHAQVRFARVQFMPDPYRLRWVRSSAFALRFLPELRLDL